MTAAERIAALEERVAELEAALGMTEVVPDEVQIALGTRLQPSACRLLGALIRHPWLSDEAADIALYGARPDHAHPACRTVTIFMCQVRKVLRRHGIAIERISGRGYRLRPADRARCAEVFNINLGEHSAAVAAQELRRAS